LLDLGLTVVRITGMIVVDGLETTAFASVVMIE